MVFRLSARQRAPVRLSALQRAADALIRRCPYFQVYLRRDTVISYGDGLSVTISSIVESRELERFFFSTIASHGVPVAVSED